jgi:hypothetical protein
MIINNKVITNKENGHDLNYSKYDKFGDLHMYSKKKRKNFVFHEPDRWLYNPSFVDSIVVGEADDHGDRGIPRYNVWFFKGHDVQPFLMKIVEYSLREVLEGLILGDQETANGEPPEHFKAVISHFS